MCATSSSIAYAAFLIFQSGKGRTLVKGEAYRDRKRAEGRLKLQHIIYERGTACLTPSIAITLGVVNCQSNQQAPMLLAPAVISWKDELAGLFEDRTRALTPKHA